MTNFSDDEESGGGDPYAIALRTASACLVQRSEFDSSARIDLLMQLRAYRQWLQLMHEGITLAALQEFFVCHKYLIMSRDLGIYREIGPLLAQKSSMPLAELAQRVFALTLQALSQPASRGGNINALLHIRGYLKAQLIREENTELDCAIELYRCGETDLTEPIILLRKHFARFPHPYIERQWFMQTIVTVAAEQTVTAVTNTNGEIEQ